MLNWYEKIQTRLRKKKTGRRRKLAPWFYQERYSSLAMLNITVYMEQLRVCRLWLLRNKTINETMCPRHQWHSEYHIPGGRHSGSTKRHHQTGYQGSNIQQQTCILNDWMNYNLNMKLAFAWTPRKKKIPRFECLEKCNLMVKRPGSD